MHDRPQARPFRQFIVKIHSRCDLACDYCYVYTMADQRWRGRPPAMSDETIDLAARRIAEHAAAHDLRSVGVILHGGEPLLAGPRRIARAATAIRTACGDRVAVGLAVQTNGTRLDAGYLRLFADLGIRVSVSLDGGREAHDRHRRGPGGRGSHAEVSRALRRLADDARFRHLFNGILCTVDLRNDPVETYESLLAFRPPAIDFLLPHGNWTAPPPGRAAGSPDTPYADWLIAVFDRWYGAPRRETGVRRFEEIMRVLLGGASRLEGVGLSPAAAAVIETDGAIESGDLLASAYEGAAATGMHVRRDPLDRALRLPLVRMRQSGAAALSDGCRACAIHRVCGGGLYVHRYRAGSGFANASVYCPDLYRLIRHVKAALDRDVAVLRSGSR